MLKVSNVRKQYTTVLAADNVSLEAKRGRILGLLGPNGAGKTTTIRMILNITRPDSGTILYDGNPFSDSVRNQIGYLPEERGLYRKNKLRNTIVYFAGLKGIEVHEAERRAHGWLRRFGLEGYTDRKVEELSKGNQQKVQFVISILHDPQLVILDEPFSGLDPLNQILLKDILLELKQQGKAVIFSTHQMDQAEKLCDEICLINRGKVVVEGELSEVKQRYGRNSIHVEFDGDGSFLSSLPSVRKAQVYENYAELVPDDQLGHRQLLLELAQRLDIRKFEILVPSLNSIFLDVVGLGDTQELESTSARAGREQREMAAPERNVRAGMTRMVIAGIATVLALGYKFLSKSDDWMLPLVLAAGTVFAFVKYRLQQSKNLHQHHDDAAPGNGVPEARGGRDEK